MEVAAAQAPELESTMLAAPPDIPVAHDPALVTNTEPDMSSFAVKIGMENPEPIPVGIAEPQPEPAPSLAEEMAAAIPAIEPPGDVPRTQKIEALVDEAPAARVVEIPKEAMAEAVASEPAEDHFVPSASAVSLEEEMRRAFSGLPVETAPAAQAAAAAAAGAASAPAMGVDVGAVAQATGTDEDKVALALERVMQRFKGELVSEIVRELKKS